MIIEWRADQIIEAKKAGRNLPTDGSYAAKVMLARDRLIEAKRTKRSQRRR